jgi:Uma2 family endonuclease
METTGKWHPSKELSSDFISLGSTTLRDELAVCGLEADDCFYIGEFAGVTESNRLDLRHDPPPHLAIEIDVSRNPLAKLPVYAELKVREIWLYDGEQVHFYLPGRTRYKQIRMSKLFPFVSPDILPAFMEQGRTKGVNAMRRSFRRWVKMHRNQADSH